MEITSREVQLPRSTASTCNENESVRSRIKKMGPICKTRKKIGVGFHNSSIEEDIDLDKHLVKEKYSDDTECTWLSSTGPSPSAFLENSRLFSSLHHSTDEWLISWLSTLASSSIKKSYGSDSSESSVANSDNVRTSLNLWYEDYSNFENSSLSSQISDSDRTSFLDSLVNLDGEDSKLIPDTELDMENLQSGFPSPSCKSFTCNDSTPGSVDLEDFGTDEPLFWPSGWKHDWSPEETWKFFSMSPRKYITKPGMPQETCSNSIESKFGVLNVNSQKGCRRRLEFRSDSTAASKILERKQRSNTNCRTKVNSATRSTPSRLRKSTKNSLKIVPVEMEDDIIIHEELPIETLLGLGEFDGHEGVDSDFNEDVFSLDDTF